MESPFPYTSPKVLLRELLHTVLDVDSACENLIYTATAEVVNSIICILLAINNDVNANGPRGTELDISAEGARVKTFVIPTDEEYMIALDTKRLVEK